MKTQTRLKLPTILLAIFLVFLVTSCEVEKEENKPVVATVDVTEIKSTEALCGGTITSDGGFAVTTRGVCWSTDPNPTIDDNKTTDGAGAGSFTSQITSLQPKTNYYVRAYAINSEGTGYGMAMAFETIDTASLSTTEPTEISYRTAVCGGTITSDGGQTITARGVCWSTSPDSVEFGNASGFTVNGSGIGSFESELIDLSPGSNYYVRAYATNNIETNYGNIISFQTTELQTPTLTTSSVVSITQTTAISGGNISSDGGMIILERGICWSTYPNPTIDDNKTSDGTGTGEFTSTLTNLSPGTTYYLRAYATNNVGTAYGMEVTFTTSDLQTPTLTTSSVVSITLTTAVSGGNISSDGGMIILERGVCWSTDPNPTIDDNKTSDGTGTGEFTSTLTNLSPGTTYYLRAYATNSVGTAYGEVVSFTTKVLPENSFFDSRDGNVYQSVAIGSQVWMAENLKYLPVVHSNVEFYSQGNSSQPGYGVYGYDGSDFATAKSQENYTTYGVLYNWYAVNTGKLCPTGWHVPSDAEWTTLENYLTANGYNYDGTTTGNKIAKAMASSSGWEISSKEGTIGNNDYPQKQNASGFTALPGGKRDFDGDFSKVGDYGYWWSSTEIFEYYAYRRFLYSGFKYLGHDTGGNKEDGYSVRCLKD